MMDGIDLIEQILLLAVTLLPVADLAATLFFANLFWQSKAPTVVEDGGVIPAVPGAERTFMTRLLGGRSWLLALLTAAFGIIPLVFAFIGFLSGRRLLGIPVEGTAPFVVIALLLLGTIPIVFAVAFWRTRRKHGSPPPFSNRD